MNIDGRGPWCPAFQQKENWGSLFVALPHKKQSWAGRQVDTSETLAPPAIPALYSAPRGESCCKLPQTLRRIPSKEAPQCLPVASSSLCLQLLCRSTSPGQLLKKSYCTTSLAAPMTAPPRSAA